MKSGNAGVSAGLPSTMQRIKSGAPSKMFRLGVAWREENQASAIAWDSALVSQRKLPEQDGVNLQPSFPVSRRWLPWPGG